MTAPSHEDKPQESEKPPPKRGNLVLPILITCLVILAGLYSPWILFISFALLPSLLIRTIDKSHKRALSFSVTGLNVTGLMLALQHSYNTYGPSPRPGMLFEDWINWVLPFGLAWMGVLFFMAFPVFFATVSEIVLQRKERRLKAQQNLLLKSWGTQLRQRIAGPPEEDKDKTKSAKD